MKTDIDCQYREALDFLYSQLPMFSRIGAAAYKPGLDTSLMLDEYFGHPHRQFKSIHVAGTNGKGSTSHMLAAVLQSQGYKVALYTSPHLVDFRERIQINGKLIPKERVIDFVDDWKSGGYKEKPSFFELTMMMAFKWFAEEKVDYAVIEVGMGGRLDSTNIITPVLSVITNISHDHNQFLGNTLQEIALEKAGIIKRGVPVVVGERQKECDEVFLNRSNETGSKITFASDAPIPTSITKSLAGSWICKYPGGEFGLNYGGDYQKKNIVTVMAAIEELRKQGVKISNDSIDSGMDNVGSLTGLFGRWTILSWSPLTIIDTGHNIAGLTYNFNQLRNLMIERPKGKLRVVLGFVADKAIEKILDILPKDAMYYVTNASIPRALDSSILNEKMLALGLNCKPYADVESAYREAKKDASQEDVIFVGGSTFIVADLLNSLKNK